MEGWREEKREAMVGQEGEKEERIGRPTQGRQGGRGRKEEEQERKGGRER